MGHPHYERSATDGEVTHVSDSGWDAPRLSLALLRADAGTEDRFRTQIEKNILALPAGTKIGLGAADTFDNSLTGLLLHLEERLEKGLTEAWFSPYCYGPAAGTAMTEEELSDEGLFWGEPEERWARAFTELTLFLAYGGIGQQYFSGEGDDKTIYEAFPEAHPVIVACQHHSTLCILSRGFTVDDVTIKGVGTGCGCTNDTLGFKIFSVIKSFDKGAAYTTVPKLLGLGTQEKPFSPGSVLIYNAGGPGTHSQNSGTAHIASVLRVSGARIQFFDTGVLQGDSSVDEGGTVDHSFLTGTVALSTNLIGVGVLDTAKRQKDLAGMVERLAGSRPLGYARLIVLDVADASKPVARFVSKLIHMRYPVSRFVWSVRGLQTEKLQVLWYLYLPAGGKEWTKGLLDAEALSKAPLELTPAKGGHLLQVNAIWGTSDGQNHVARRKLGKSITSVKDENGKPTGELLVTDQDGWMQDFQKGAPGKPAPGPIAEMAFDVTLALPGRPRLEDWCMRRETFGLRYRHDPSAADGSAGEGATNVGFFDP